MRHRQRHDDLAEDLGIGGAKRPRHAHVDRTDLRNAFVHDDDTGEERRVEQDDDLRRFADAEIDDHQRDQRDRRQRPEEVEQGVDEAADVAVPAEHEADRHGERDAERNADEHALRRHPDVERKAGGGQELPELRRDLVRRGHERRVDEAGIGDRVPEGDDDDPRRDDQERVAEHRADESGLEHGGR